MTLTRLTTALAIGVTVIDIKFNNGQLGHAALDQATQWCYWLNDEFSNLLHQISPAH